MAGDFAFDSSDWADKSEAVQNFIKGLLVKDPKGRMTAKAAL